MSHPSINYALLPQPLQAGMRRYVEAGILPGHFLQAVITNNLVLAFLRADETNIIRMRDIVLFLHCEMPYDSWGSEEKMLSWSKARQF